MDELNSKRYYLSREQHERKLADEATDPAIAAIHRDMAERYRARVVGAVDDDEELKPRLKIRV